MPTLMVPPVLAAAGAAAFSAGFASAGLAGAVVAAGAAGLVSAGLLAGAAAGAQAASSALPAVRISAPLRKRRRDTCRVFSVVGSRSITSQPLLAN